MCSFNQIIISTQHAHLNYFSRWKNDSSQHSGLDSGPLVLFNVHDDAMVFSPYNNFMDMSAVYEKSATGSIVSWGVMGKVDKIPLGYTSWTGLVYSHEGINMVSKRIYHDCVFLLMFLYIICLISCIK